MWVSWENYCKRYSRMLFFHSYRYVGRTTGLTATAVMNLIIDNKINATGIITPEEIAFDNSNFDFVVDYLKSQKISIQNVEKSNGRLI